MDHHDAPDVGTNGSDLPPLRAHRQSRSEVPFAFLPPLPLWPSDGAGVKMESHDGVAGDDLFDAFMDLDGFDMLNSSEDNHRRDSGSRMNGTENEAESNTSLGAAKQGWADRPGLVTVASRHCRSLSMDSCTGRFHFEEEPSKLQRPCRGFRAESSARVDCPDTEPNTFILEFGNGQFTAAEMKKIMEDQKLVELAMADPKRVKRILANRQSAARSKERKMRYIAELEHKVQALQSETTTLSLQLTLLQRDSTGLINKNNELKFRLQAMEQQAQLRDAFNEALNIEVQRLKLASSGLVDAHDLSGSNHQPPFNAQAMDFREEQ
ncbi:bZIP transcription factor 29-like [Zingiber officinale]|uniref:bZIP transcription factor 29-like n=1 Tax=Zingiber officinale TaxID=94328 RepID=UPI001C4D0570|nr:bZIP transcription factor 29-like [Zingiber officinale]